MTISCRLVIWWCHSWITQSGGAAKEKNADRVSIFDEDIGDDDDNDNDSHFLLWSNYVWDGPSLSMEEEGIERVTGMSFGFGAAANFVPDLVNVDQLAPLYDSTGLHPSKDAGVGAFTYYHEREIYATADIQEGNELLVDYGKKWLQARAQELPPVPDENQIRVADNLLRKFQELKLNLSNRDHDEEVAMNMCESFVANNPFNDTSRVLFGLPKTWRDTEIALETSLHRWRRRQHSRPISWIQQHGVCADNLYSHDSTIPQAGHGAFANVLLSRGSIVAPFPLIYIPDKERLLIRLQSKHKKANITSVSSHQLLLKYCMEHPKPTLSLCPYGLHTSLINHDHDRVNVALRWADPTRSSHHPDWLNQSVDLLQGHHSAGLAMELVALRDIQAGEEFLLDYGKEWQRVGDTMFKRGSRLRTVLINLRSNSKRVKKLYAPCLKN